MSAYLDESPAGCDDPGRFLHIQQSSEKARADDPAEPAEYADPVEPDRVANDSAQRIETAAQAGERKPPSEGWVEIGDRRHRCGFRLHDGHDVPDDRLQGGNADPTLEIAAVVDEVPAGNLRGVEDAVHDERCASADDDDIARFH